MAGGVHKYTVVEAQNIQLGQCRSAYLDDTGAYTVASGDAVVAITIIQDAKFTTITQEDTDNCFGDSGTDDSNSGGTGDIVVDTTLFPAGITLFGRWTAVTLASGVAVLYMAR